MADGTDAKKQLRSRHWYGGANKDAFMQTARALQQTGLKSLIIAGGVSANLRLRAGLQAMVEKEKSQLFYAKPRFCTTSERSSCRSPCCSSRVASRPRSGRRCARTRSSARNSSRR